LGAGINYSLTKTINLYANAQYSKNINITYAQANIGAKLKFQTRVHKQKPPLKETVVYEKSTNENIAPEPMDIDEPSSEVAESVIIRVLVQKSGKTKWLKPLIISAKVFDESGTATRLPYKVQQKVRQVMRNVKSNNQSITRIRVSIYGTKTQSPQQLKVAKQRAYLIYESMK
jgi:hypothetical protein